MKSQVYDTGNVRRTDKVSSTHERTKDGRRRTGHKVETDINR